MSYKLFFRDRGIPPASELPSLRMRGKRILRAARAFAIIACALAFAGTVSEAQLGKANLILLNQGLQLQSMVQSADFFNLTTYTNANFTSVSWLSPSSPSSLGSPPGFPWGRWVTDPTDMPPQNGEDTYLSSLQSLELSDEPNLQDGPTYTNERKLVFVQAKQLSEHSPLREQLRMGRRLRQCPWQYFIAAAHPDMLCFDDEYPFTAQYDTNYSNSINNNELAVHQLV